MPEKTIEITVRVTANLKDGGAKPAAKPKSAPVIKLAAVGQRKAA